MKIYLKVVGLVAFVAIVFGFVLPFLISAANTELVLGGFALLILVVVPTIFYWVKSILTDCEFLIEKDEKE